MAARQEEEQLRPQTWLVAGTLPLGHHTLALCDRTCRVTKSQLWTWSWFITEQGILRDVVCRGILGNLGMGKMCQGTIGAPFPEKKRDQRQGKNNKVREAA